MSRTKNQERRQNPRVNQQLAFNVKANGYDFETTTQNISCLGAYCHIEKYVPPFTKVMVKLSLPIANNCCNVECKGVIVRAEDSRDGGFNIAIFFNEIKDSQRKLVSQYISQFLPN